MVIAKLKRKFSSARSCADRRGIPFRLTFDEWLSVWKPHLHRLSTERLDMCRTGDSGSYELGNVRIDTHGSNMAERSAIAQRKRIAADAAHTLTLPAIMARVEGALVSRAIAKAGGSRTNAARILGISFRQFRYLANKYAL